MGATKRSWEKTLEKELMVVHRDSPIGEMYEHLVERINELESEIEL